MIPQGAPNLLSSHNDRSTSRSQWVHVIQITLILNDHSFKSSSGFMLYMLGGPCFLCAIPVVCFLLFIQMIAVSVVPMRICEILWCQLVSFPKVFFCHSHVGFLPGGYVSNSLAIMTDAVHMLTDVVGILFSLLALWLSNKPPTKRFTFGLHRLGK